MLLSTIPVSIIGTRFAMGVEPFWTPAQYSKSANLVCSTQYSRTTVPVVGMLCGNAISGIVVSLNYTLKEMQYVYSSRKLYDAE